MAFFKNITNAKPGKWHQLFEMSGYLAPVLMSQNLRYYYIDIATQIRHYYSIPGAPKSTAADAHLSDDPLARTAVYQTLLGAPPFDDKRRIYFEIYSSETKGQDIDGFAIVEGDTYHATISTIVDDLDADVARSDVTVTLFDADGAVLTGAKVEIRLVGVGVGGEPINGAISPGIFSRKTNGAGRATFSLWRNAGHSSGAFYEVRSWHPRTRKPIHASQKFFVGLDQPEYDLGDLLDIVN